MTATSISALFETELFAQFIVRSRSQIDVDNEQHHGFQVILPFGKVCPFLRQLQRPVPICCPIIFLILYLVTFGCQLSVLTYLRFNSQKQLETSTVDERRW